MAKIKIVAALTCILRLTLNSIRGPFRPESHFAFKQHWYLAAVTLKTLCILQSRLSECYIEDKKFNPNQHSWALEARWSLIM